MINQPQTQNQYQTQTLPDDNRALLDVIALRWETTPDVWTDRGMAVGGVGTGKSTLCEVLIDLAVKEYSDLRVLILDTKPRFRAQWETNGLSAAHRYRGWDPAKKPIPGSYALPFHSDDLDTVWKLGGRIAIAQTDNGDPDDVKQIEAILDTAWRFFQESQVTQPQLLYIDEVMDFYNIGGHSVTPKGANVILRCVRSGRERGLGVLFASQRPRNIPVQLPQESNKLYLFQLRNENDLARLSEFDNPDVLYDHMPDRRRLFYYMDHEDPETAGLYELTGVK